MNNFRIKLFKEHLKYSFSRKDSTKKIFYSIIAIIVAIIISACVTAMVGFNPFEMISKLFTKAFEYEPKKLIYNISIFTLAGLSFSFAFKANIFNIGISGQMFSAGVTLLVISKALENIVTSSALGQIISLVVCVSVSSFFAWLIALMERYLKVNIVVSGILMNWILYLLGFFVISSWYPNTLEGNAVMTASVDIPEKFRLIWGNADSYVPIIVITILLAAIIFIIFKFTSYGKKMEAIGLSIDGSKYVGYKVNRIRMRTFVISGALAGIMALVLYTTQVPEIPLTDLNVNVPSEGFNGIAVGLLANNNPIGIILVSCALGLFKTSSSYLWEKPVFNDVIIGVLILVIIIFTLLEKYKPWYKIKNIKYKTNLDKNYLAFESKINELIFKYKIEINNLKKDTKNNKEIISKLNQEYDREKEMIIEDYYESIIKSIINENFNPKDKLDHGMEKIIKYYESDYSLYVSKLKNKLTYLNKLESKFICNFLSKNLSNLNDEEIKILSIIFQEKNISVNDLTKKFNNSPNILENIKKLNLVIENNNELSIDLKNEIIIKYLNKYKLIKLFINKRKIRIFSLIKKANNQTKDWVKYSNKNLMKNISKSYYRKENKSININGKEVNSSINIVHVYNRVCKDIIENKITNLDKKNILTNFLIENNNRIEKEELW